MPLYLAEIVIFYCHSQVSKSGGDQHIYDKLSWGDSVACFLSSWNTQGVMSMLTESSRTEKWTGNNMRLLKARLRTGLLHFCLHAAGQSPVPSPMSSGG
jgi:hypothetical protein